ncbi:hypothetical protein ACSS6W_001271 [Trichoderma asperelloides]
MYVGTAQSMPRRYLSPARGSSQIISDGGLCWGDASHDLHGRPMLDLSSSLPIVNSSTKSGQRRRSGLADIFVPRRTFATGNNGSTECLNASQEAVPPSGPPARLLSLCMRWHDAIPVNESVSSPADQPSVEHASNFRGDPSSGARASQPFCSAPHHMASTE